MGLTLMAKAIMLKSTTPNRIPTSLFAFTRFLNLKKRNPATAKFMEPRTMGV